MRLVAAERRDLGLLHEGSRSMTWEKSGGYLRWSMGGQHFMSDKPQNVISCSWSYCEHFGKMSVENLFIYAAKRKTDRQRPTLKTLPH